MARKQSDAAGTYERLYTPAEVAIRLRVDPKTVTRWAKQGKLRVVLTPGGHRRYYVTDVTELLNGGPK